MREGHLIPVVFTSARTGAGIAELLEVIVKLLPNPTEGNAAEYEREAGDGGREAGGGKREALTAGPPPDRKQLRHDHKIDSETKTSSIPLLPTDHGGLSPH